jgi:hypothetical protein
MRYPNGSVSVLSPGPWAQLLAVKHCPCSDGVARRARVTGQPDTFFSIPASVQVKGKTVSGFLTNSPTYIKGVKEGYIFIAVSYGKNGHLLPRFHEWDTRHNEKGES